RIDRARGTDRDEQVRADERGEDIVHPVGHLAEPDDIGPERGLSAGRARRPVAQRACPAVARVAGGAPGRQAFAVHVQHPPRAAALVQVVDVLGDDQQLAVPRLVEPPERAVRGIGLRVEDVAPALVVEPLHEVGIAAEPLRRGHVLDPVVFPKPVVGAEGPEAAFGADSGAGEDDDVADAVHSPHEARAPTEAQWPASASSAAQDAWARHWSGRSRKPDTSARAALTGAATWPRWPTAAMRWSTSPLPRRSTPTSTRRSALASRSSSARPGSTSATTRQSIPLRSPCRCCRPAIPRSASHYSPTSCARRPRGSGPSGTSRCSRCTTG